LTGWKNFTSDLSNWLDQELKIVRRLKRKNKAGIKGKRSLKVSRKRPESFD
jgi:hypothetical protein